MSSISRGAPNMQFRYSYAIRVSHKHHTRLPEQNDTYFDTVSPPDQLSAVITWTSLFVHASTRFGYNFASTKQRGNSDISNFITSTENII